jgi:hypothetical protein
MPIDTSILQNLIDKTLNSRKKAKEDIVTKNYLKDKGVCID